MGIEGENMNRNIIARLNDNLPQMSKGHKKIAEYILENYEKAAFMTASKLGGIVGVSESTVVRFATELGFDGYPEMQRALRHYTCNHLTSVQRIELMDDQIGTQNVYEKVLSLDMERIRTTLEECNMEEFNNAVDVISKSRNVYIIGARSTGAIASFMAFYFNVMFENVKLITTASSSEMFEQILRIGENDGDVMIGLSFPRYSRRTLEAVQYAHNNGVKVIAITDSATSPIVDSADYSILARSYMDSFVDSLVAPLSVINALIVSIGIKRREYVSKNFERLERIWDEYKIYDKPAEEKKN